MGYSSFVIKKVISYFLVLYATMSILYVFTYPIIQQVIVKSANFFLAQERIQILKAHPDTSPSQLNFLLKQAEQTYLAAFGFNQPLPVKYVIQMKQLLTLNFGTAYFLRAPDGSANVNTIIASYLPNTIILFTTATIIVVAVGTLIGLLAARYVGSFWDRLIPTIAVLHSSLPSWWIGFLLIAGLAYGLRAFPPGGITSVPPPKTAIGYFLSVGDHMVLPILAIFIVGVGGFAYVVRSLVISTMGEDFVTSLRARGIPERKVLFKHVLRTTSPSIATQVILAVASSLAGSLTLEVVFLWPGVGLLTYNAILSNDVPVIMGVTYVLTIVLLIGLLLGELVYGLLDPRIKVE